MSLVGCLKGLFIGVEKYLQKNIKIDSFYFAKRRISSLLIWLFPKMILLFPLRPNTSIAKFKKFNGKRPIKNAKKILK